MTYRHIPALTSDGALYIRDDTGIIESLICPGRYTTAHAPALLEAANGDILCAWFAGTYEGNSDISIVCARLNKGEDHWAEPIQVSGDPERSEQNPSLFQHPDGSIRCMYTAQRDRVEGIENMQYTAFIREQISTDFGYTWSTPKVIFPDPGSFCRQPIQILASGRWIFVNWICSDAYSDLAGDPTVFRISDDQGNSWRTVSMPDSRGAVHANVVELDPGHLICYLRSRFADNIYISRSDDNGDTWTKPIPTELPNNNASISAIKLHSGRIAIAYNPTRASDCEYGKARWPGLRCPVAVALSEDNGESFPLIRIMEPGEGFAGIENQSSNKRYEYPCLMQSRDDTLHLAFACKDRLGIKYMRFSEDDVIGPDRGRHTTFKPTTGGR